MYTSVKLIHVAPATGNVTLEYLNEELFQLHIPALIFIVFGIVVGIIGNSLVLLIYKTKFRRSNHRYFILFLAFFDFIACAVGMPFLVSSLRLPYLIESAAVCKTMRYVSYAVNNSSGLLLLVVSIERYRKICRPLKKQLSSNQILYLCLVVALISAILAIPSAIFYGESTIDTGVGNITGTQCYVEDERRDSPLFEIYMLVLLMEALICIIIFIILYVFIIRRLFASDVFMSTMRSMQIKNNFPDHTSDSYSDANVLDVSTDKESSSSGNIVELKTKEQPSASVTFVATIDSTSLPNLPEQVEKIIPEKHEDNCKDDTNLRKNRSKSDYLDNRINIQVVQPNLKQKIQKSNTITPTQKLAYGNIIKSSKTTKMKRNQSTLSRGSSHSKTTNRVTIMLFMVSLVFAISFIPHLVLMILTAHYKRFLENMGSGEIIVFQVFLRSFVLNNIANPIIYLYCDSKFRRYCSEIVRCKFRISDSSRR